MRDRDSLERIERDGRVEFRLHGATLLEGIQVFGRIEAGFTAASGVESRFLLTGSGDAGSFALTGRGRMSVHGLALEDATVQASAEGVWVASPVAWRSERKPMRLARAASGEPWRGLVTFEEELPCSTPPRPRLAVSVEVEAGPERTAVWARGAVSGLDDEAGVEAQPGDGLDACVKAARKLLFAALQRQALEGAEALEDTLQEWEADWTLPAGEVAAADGERETAAGPDARGAGGGYLGRVAPGAGKGYLSRPARAQGGGYLGSSRPAASKAAGGYLGATRAARAGRKGANAAGAPAGVPAAGSGVSWTVAGGSALRKSTVLAIIRCKDVLYALEAAAGEE